MVVMQVIGLTVDSSTKTPLVVLQDMEGKEILPIWIGAMEAMSISLALSGSTLPRPLTHDLLLHVLVMLGSALEAVEIVELREGAYRADILLRQDGARRRLDCRPSDGIALALRAGVPIRVSPEVLRAAAEARLRPDEHEPAKIIQPEDVAADMIRRVAHAETLSGQKPAAESTLASAIHAAEHDDDERYLADLLRKLEPDSQRRM